MIDSLAPRFIPGVMSYSIIPILHGDEVDIDLLSNAARLT